MNSETLAKEFTKVSGADIKDIIFMAAVNAIERTEYEMNEAHKAEDEAASTEISDNEKAQEENSENDQPKLIVIHSDKNCDSHDEYEEIHENNECYEDAADEEIHEEVHESAFTKAEEPEENKIDAVITMEDFREAYRNIKNRYAN